MYKRAFLTKKGWTNYTDRVWEPDGRKVNQDGETITTWSSRQRTRKDESLSKVHYRIFGVDEDGTVGEETA